MFWVLTHPKNKTSQGEKGAKKDLAYKVAVRESHTGKARPHKALPVWIIIFLNAQFTRTNCNGPGGKIGLEPLDEKIEEGVFIIDPEVTSHNQGAEDLPWHTVPDWCRSAV